MKLIKIFIAIAILAGFASCEKFLEEENRSIQSTETSFTTPDGLEALIYTCYSSLRIFYGKEEGYDFSTAATDIYDYGQQHDYKDYFEYQPSWGPNQNRILVLWIELYKGVNACNDAIFYLDAERTPFDEAKTAVRMSEVRFLRSVYNWLIAEQWGDVQFRREPIRGVVKVPDKNTKEQAYEMMLEDLTFAINNLGDGDNVSDAEYGRVNKNAALAFRARVNFTLAYHLSTGYMTGFGSPNDYFTAASNDADAVINSGDFTLWDDYNDMWDIANNTFNSENIWQINYSLSAGALMGHPNEEFTDLQGPGKLYNEREGGHHGHLMFGVQYDIHGGFIRDIENGRPFRRYTPTSYLLNAFNENLDERFDGTFKTAFLYNDSSTIPRFPIVTEDGITINPNPGQPIRALGDTGIYLTKTDYPDDVIKRVEYTRNGALTNSSLFYNTEKNFFVVDYRRMYGDNGMMIEGDEADPNDGTMNRNIYVQLDKFYDNTRPAETGDGSMRGARDSYVIRYPEMFLIKSEAQWKLGNATAAYDALIPLADKRSKDGDGAALLAGYDINSGGDLDLDFYMDERAREFCGEQMRWFDLKRIGPAEHIARMQKYAGNAAARQNFAEMHTLRPIPQIQLDAQTDTTVFTQNPGY